MAESGAEERRVPGRGDDPSLLRAFLATGAGQLLLLVLATATIVGGTVLTYQVFREPPELPPVQIRSVAVLPLSNQTGDPEQAPFVDGLHDALIAELSRLQGLSVISRTSVQRYRETRAPVSRVASELAVDAVVEGSVLRAFGGTVAVVVRLVLADPERRIWSGRYESTQGEAFALQRRVADAIAREISMVMTPGGPADFAVSEAAQEAYFQGRAHWRIRARESLVRAVDYLEEAVALEPDFALAHAALADAYTVARGYGAIDLTWDEAYERAEAHARRALQLDPRLAEAHASLGFLRLQAHGDLVGAEQSLREAVRLNPSLAQAQAWLALTLKAAGRAEEGVEPARIARRLDPFSPVMILSLGYTLVGARQCAEALEQSRAVIELDPDFPDAYALAWRCHVLAGDRQAAVVSQNEVFRRWKLPDEVVRAHLRAWETRGWEAALQEEIRIFEAGLPSVRGEYFAAQRHAQLGDVDAAVAALLAARDARDPLFLFELRTDPLLDPIRHDPRVQALVDPILAEKDG